jgi:pectinesterase
VVLVGDSTLAPRSGYGDALCGLFKWQVECVNLARGGRSTKSFRADGSWERVMGLLRERKDARANYVLIQFGHNDQPGKAERTTDLATEFPANLARYVDETRAAGAQPVLVTPLTRRQFGSDGRLKEDLAPWAQAAARVARERGVPLLDLNADSAAAVSRMGAAEADKLARGVNANPGFDHTHLGPRGAAFFARMVAREIARALPAVAAELAVGAIEPPGRIARPQLTAAQARAYSYREVLGDWDPLAEMRSPRAPDYIVDAAAKSDGPTTFRTVQEAINAAVVRAARETQRIHILVRPGTYEELVYIPDSPAPITLQGEGDAAAVRIRAKLDATLPGAQFAHAFGRGFANAPPAIAAMFDAVAGRATVATPGSAVVWVRNRGFRAVNLTIENAHNKDRGDTANQSQAVALMLDDADRAHLENVRLLGYQDTFYLRASSPSRPVRAFVDRSYVEGDMDFIFGEATAYFRATEIRSLGDRAVSYALAPSTHIATRHGFVFDGCRFTHDGSPNARAGVFQLARQWYRSAESVGKVAILNSSIGTHIDPVRPWADWSIGTPRHRPVQYESAAGEVFLAEYNNVGERP